MPGVPLILIGRTKYLSWGITAALADVADLYREKIVGNKYELDGEMIDLKIVSHDIKVKDSDSVKFDLQYTHRGPVLTSKAIRNA